MKAEKFSQQLNQIQDKYIEEAAAFQAPKQPAAGKGPKSMKVWRAVAIAACALLAVGIGAGIVGLSSGNGDSSGTYKNEAVFTEPDYGEDGINSYDAYAGGEQAAYTGEPELAEGAASGGAKSGASMVPQNENAKIIYTASMNIETNAFDDSAAKIEEATKKHGGYFENMDQNNTSHSYRRAEYLIRIPAEEFEAFLKDTDGFGTVTSVSKNAEDISDTYFDTESRLNTARAKMARLQELLGAAQNMSDIITIENEIADVQYQIDSLSGQLNSYDSQVAYSTVSIRLDEVYKTTADAKPLSFGERISKAFSNGLSGFGSFLEDFAVWFAESWIWVLIVLGVIAAAIFIPITAVKKSRKKK